MDLVRSRPLPGLVAAATEYTLDAAYGIPGERILVYLADERELGTAGAGDWIEGTVILTAPPGTYRVAAFSPETGEWSPAVRVTSDGRMAIDVPRFRHDLLLDVTRA
jgi:hypothetical protein